jgi:methylphosphotriester-DNA--protein-cysteine methyltransferase
LTIRNVFHSAAIIAAAWAAALCPAQAATSSGAGTAKPAAAKPAAIAKSTPAKSSVRADTGRAKIAANKPARPDTSKPRAVDTVRSRVPAPDSMKPAAADTPATAKTAVAVPHADSLADSLLAADSMDLDSLLVALTTGKKSGATRPNSSAIAPQAAKPAASARRSAGAPLHSGIRPRPIARHGFGLLVLIAAIALAGIAIAALLGRRESRRFMTTTRLSLMDTEVQRACKYIEKKYQDPSLNPETLCAALVTGQAFLQALFERELGMTVDEFIDQVRVNQSQFYLKKHPAALAAEVARASGFTDEQQFCKAFERICSISFDRYRSSAQSTAA